MWIRLGGESPLHLNKSGEDLWHKTHSQCEHKFLQPGHSTVSRYELTFSAETINLLHQQCYLVRHIHRFWKSKDPWKIYIYVYVIYLHFYISSFLSRHMRKQCGNEWLASQASRKEIELFVSIPMLLFVVILKCHFILTFNLRFVKF